MHFLFSIFFLNRAVYEIIWKTIVEPDKPQMTIWRMRIAFRIPKATNTHSEYVILFVFFTATMVERTRLNVTLYLHCLSFYYFSQVCTIIECYFIIFLCKSYWYRFTLILLGLLIYVSYSLHPYKYFVISDLKTISSEHF